MNSEGIGRREFGKLVAGATELSLQKPATRRSTVVGAKVIGIQIGAVSFLDEGIEKCLDTLQKLGQINCLSLSAFTYSVGTGGRQVAGYPLPDHGKQEYDMNWRGGNFAAVHPEYYKDVGIDPLALRAPEHGSWDFLENVPPSAKKRGITNLAWIADKWPPGIPGLEKLGEVDVNGRPGRGASLTCHNNPYYRNLMLGIVEDYMRSYDIDGIHYCQERGGPMMSAMGGGAATCFCEFCRKKAVARGISVERTMAGYREMQSFGRSARAGARPPDGYYVSFWRLLLRFPEILAWETFYEDTIKETYQALNERVKSIKPNAWFGLHIHHAEAFSIIHRAALDTSDLVKYGDFLKIVMYQNVSGNRLVHAVEHDCQGVYRDLMPAEMTQFLYRVMNYHEEPYDKVAKTGFIHDYVYRESKRAMDGARGSKTMIFSGLDIDLPAEANESHCTPASVRAAVTQAFQAGVPGVILSRKYSEMRLANLAAVGTAVKELGLV